ncbi:hypothetical protein ACP70R_007648 [Stipagrostis hirtigluma subsp. patula]
METRWASARFFTTRFHLLPRSRAPRMAQLALPTQRNIARAASPRSRAAAPSLPRSLSRPLRSRLPPKSSHEIGAFYRSCAPIQCPPAQIVPIPGGRLSASSNPPPIPMDRGGSRKARSRSRRPNGGDAPAAGAAGGGARPPRAAGGGVGAPSPRAAGSVGGGAPSPRAGPDVGAPTGAHDAGSWWPGPSLGGSFPDPSPTSSEWFYPPGGFMNYLQSPIFSPFAQPHPFGNYPNGMHPSGTPSTSGSTAADASKGSEEKETIDVDDDDATPIRSDKRLNWSHEEDIRLVSAWLHNSIDSVDGNDKKGDQYWSDVTATYNSTTERNRQRNRNQLKLRWERIKKPVNEFNGCYTTITKVHESGMSDDQQMDKALELYASEHSDKPFTMVHIWKILRHERKWSAYVKRKSKEKEKSATLNPAPVVNVDNTPKERPVGRNKAKDERNGKRKAPETISVIDQKLDRFIEASTKAREEREKVAEVQQNLANKKVEAARLNHKAAQEQTKCKMLELYKDLLFASTNDLSTEALAERTKALETMRLAMCPKDD